MTDLKYVTSENWKEFEDKYHDADYFLGRCSLLNERKHLLTNEYILNNWQKSRLAELEEWHYNMVLIKELV